MRRKRLAAFFSSCFLLKDRITEDRGDRVRKTG